MATLHNPAERTAIEARVQALRPDSQRVWGKMSVDQMLWHVNRVMESALGRYKTAPRKAPISLPILRFVVLNLPWPKGRMPTNPEFVATGKYDFESERSQCQRLIHDIASKDIGGQWSAHPTLGNLDGRYYSRLMAKHLNHHLTQFSA